MFPKTIETINLPRTRPGQSRPRRRLLPGERILPTDFIDPEDDESRQAENGAAGGVSLDFGKSSVGLRKSRRGWGWNWVDEVDTGKKLVVGEGVCLFPSTRDVPKPVDLPLQALLSASNDYISTIPELDNHSVVPEIISEEVVKTYNTQKNPPRDVYKGQTVCVIELIKGILAKWIVVFPTGDLGNQLNISPFLPKSNAKRHGNGVSKFVPTSRPVHRFPTEILQITSSPATSAHKVDYNTTILAVRLQYSTYLFTIRPNDTYSPPTTASPVEVELVGILPATETEGRRHVDVALDSFVWQRVAIVDEGGAVWVWTVLHGTGRDAAKRLKVERLRPPMTTDPDQFFRISFSTQSDTLLLLSNRKAMLLSLYTPGEATTLLHLRGPQQCFTSLEKTASSRQAQYTVLCTSLEVLWVDESLPGKSFLGWRHGIGAGKLDDLEVCVVESEVGESVFLSSRSNPLIMVFNTTSSAPIKSLHPPYSISLPIPESARPLGSFASIQMALDSVYRKAPTLLLGQAADLSLWSTSLEAPYPAVNSRRRSGKNQKLRVRWSEELQNLDKGMIGGTESLGEKGKTKSRVIDFRWAWLHINQDTEGQDFSVDDFETFLREMDAHLDHLTTAAELARDSVQTEDPVVRSHLLQELSKSQAPAVHDRLDLVSFEKFALIVIKSGSTLSASTLQELKKTHIKSLGNPKSAGFITRQSDLNRLALDLSLSDIVCSSEHLAPVSGTTRPVLATGSPDDLFERAAGLSLKDREPPLIQFGILTPFEVDEDSTRPDIQSLTARHLLTDWTISSKPREYQWKSWLDPHLEDTLGRPIRPLPSPRIRQSGTLQSQMSPTQGRTQTQPSKIPTFSSTQPPLHHPQPLRATFSVPIVSQTIPAHPFSSPPLKLPSRPNSGVQSQEMEFPNTQVERGPFGGRFGGEGRGKKKMGKKRVGGF